MAACFDAVLLFLTLKSGEQQSETEIGCENQDECDDEQMLRYMFAIDFFAICQTLCWTVV